jgi:hypothetical protein
MMALMVASIARIVMQSNLDPKLDLQMLNTKLLTLQSSNPRILRKIVQGVEVLFSVLRLSLAKGKNFTKNVQLVLLAKIN